MRRAAGFTLIEILIALAIVAIGLAAALRTSSLGTDGVREYRQRLLASWLADNLAAERAARGDWPNVGDTGSEESMAGERFVVRASVKSTPNPHFRRLDIEVAAADAPEHRLRHLAIFLTSP